MLVVQAVNNNQPVEHQNIMSWSNISIATKARDINWVSPITTYCLVITFPSQSLSKSHTMESYDWTQALSWTLPYPPCFPLEETKSILHMYLDIFKTNSVIATTIFYMINVNRGVEVIRINTAIYFKIETIILIGLTGWCLTFHR